MTSVQNPQLATVDDSEEMFARALAALELNEPDRIAAPEEAHEALKRSPAAIYIIYVVSSSS
jgi:hypothetical protein